LNICYIFAVYVTYAPEKEVITYEEGVGVDVVCWEGSYLGLKAFLMEGR
jgi:hypothetical protein